MFVSPSDWDSTPTGADPAAKPAAEPRGCIRLVSRLALCVAVGEGTRIVREVTRSRGPTAVSRTASSRGRTAAWASAASKSLDGTMLDVTAGEECFRNAAGCASTRHVASEPRSGDAWAVSGERELRASRAARRGCLRPARDMDVRSSVSFGCGSNAVRLEARRHVSVSRPLGYRVKYSVDSEALQGSGPPLFGVVLFAFLVELCAVRCRTFVPCLGAGSADAAGASLSAHCFFWFGHTPWPVVAEERRSIRSSFAVQVFFLDGFREGGVRVTFQ